jgi:hypothetical protein
MAWLAPECSLGLDDAFEDGRQQHQIHERGIELSAPTRGDHFGGGSGTAAAAIAAIVRHGVERIGEGHDAS